MKESMSDFSQSPSAGIEYYESVVDHMGQQAVDGFMRLYVTPGADHPGRGLTRLDIDDLPSGVDLLSVLDGWIKHNRAPDILIQVAQDEAALRGHGFAPDVPVSSLASLQGLGFPDGGSKLRVRSGR